MSLLLVDSTYWLHTAQVIWSILLKTFFTAIKTVPCPCMVLACRSKADYCGLFSLSPYVKGAAVPAIKPHLTSIRARAQTELESILKHVRGDKCLVIDPKLSGSLSLLVQSSELKGRGRDFVPIVDFIKIRKFIVSSLGSNILSMAAFRDITFSIIFSNDLSIYGSEDEDEELKGEDKREEEEEDEEIGCF
ncbi:Sec1/munc18-like (SM) proteins superfamily [Striga asiatica]|uniref:Sec1/munc18-like (SM) proteins superfamily n=1 Tax=Striga asiatica TaxID=4170 RepID=A0A5A7PRF5_STRAF|nr:Sec1/munc18-like (SM) proteins superfamily [Striga asiatica]